LNEIETKKTKFSEWSTEERAALKNLQVDPLASKDSHQDHAGRAL
jgi:hypothetical protein